MKNQYIEKLSPGQPINDIFIVEDKSISQTRDGKDYINFTFSDKTGRVRGVAWDNAASLSLKAGAGDFARVKGLVSEYKGSCQITVKNIEACSRESVDPADFLPVTTRDVEKMLDRLKRVACDFIDDKHLKLLVDSFLNDESFCEKFKRAPAAKKMHHAYLGGLLEHTLSMTVLAKEIIKHYNGVNRALLLTGVILHDIGKIREFEYEYKIGYTDEGMLVSHIVMGCEMVSEKIRNINGFPKDLEYLIRHMIVSHHGTREFGSPEPPKTLEAVLLNLIDNIDAKMNGIRSFIAKENPDEAWTSYNYMLSTKIYKGKKEAL